MEYSFVLKVVSGLLMVELGSVKEIVKTVCSDF